MTSITRRQVVSHTVALGGIVALSSSELGSSVAAQEGGATPAATPVTTSALDHQTDRYRPLDFSPFADDLATVDDAWLAEMANLVMGKTTVDLQAALDAGDLTSADLTMFYLARIQMYDEMLRGYIELNPTALDDARAADAARANGDATGALFGIPVSLKDNIETAGPMHTTAGAIVLADNVVESDSPVAQSLRETGAVILGKASLSEFAGAVNLPGANAMSGQGINPYGPAFATAGSSSGSAIGTSAYLTGLSVGTETSGSLIAPSSFQGVVGMKPSTGVVPGEGIVPLVPSNDSAGPIARSVTDLAALLSVIAATGDDFTAGLDAAALQGVTAGLLRVDILAQAPALEDTSDNPAIVDRIVDGLEVAGATVVDTELPPLDGIDNAFTLILLDGTKWDMPTYLAGHTASVATLDDLIAFNDADPAVRIPNGPGILEVAAANAQSEADYRALIEPVREGMTALLDAGFASSGASVLVSLTNAHSILYATAGYPAITIPVGLRANGMPTGVTLIGKAGEDAALIGYAYAFEQATNLRIEPDLAWVAPLLATPEPSLAATPAG